MNVQDNFPFDDCRSRAIKCPPLMGGADFLLSKKNSQQGAAVLAVTVILLLVVTIGALGIGKLSSYEQKAVAIDTRSKEVYSAAVGGLDYGVNYFKENFSALFWQCGAATCDSNDSTFVGATATAPNVPRPDGTPGTTDLQADDYTITVTYTMRSRWVPDNVETGNPRIVTVTATATAQNDSHVTKTVQQDLMWSLAPFTTRYLDSGGGLVIDSPPLTIEDCMYDNTGTPDLYPNIEVQEGIAMLTTQGTADDDCFNPGHIELCVDDSANTNDTCYDPEVYSHDFGTPYRSELEPDRTLWDTIFGNLTKADLRAMESQNPDQIFFVDSTYPHYSGQPALTGGDWKTSVGTEDHPVIVFVDEDMQCIDFGGADSGNPVTIWGLVYIEKPDPLPDPSYDGCRNNGWGHMEIYGVLAQEGSMYNLNANVNLYGWPVNFDDGSGGNDDGTITTGASYHNLILKIPGTWRDFTDADYE